MPSEQHADGTSRLAVYDFLLGFYTDFRLIGGKSKSTDRNP